jgi:hypothetical protein
MASARLSRRVEKDRRLPAALRDGRRPAARVPRGLLDADGFEDLPEKWQAGVVAAEQSRPKLRVATSD